MRRRRARPRKWRRKFNQKLIQRKKKSLTTILRFKMTMIDMSLKWRWRRQRRRSR